MPKFDPFDSAKIGKGLKSVASSITHKVRNRIAKANQERKFNELNPPTYQMKRAKERETLDTVLSTSPMGKGNPELIKHLQVIFSFKPWGKDKVSKEAAKFLDGKKSSLGPISKGLLGKASSKIKKIIRVGKKDSPHKDLAP